MEQLRIEEMFSEPQTQPVEPETNQAETIGGDLAELETKSVKEIEYCLRQMETQAHKLRGILANMEAAQTLQKSLKPENDVYNNKGQYQFEKDLFQISVKEESGIVEILIPALLPHRKNKPEILFMDALAKAIGEYMGQEGNRFPAGSPEGFLLIILHSYKRKWMVRDNDNIEIGAVINTLVTTGLIQKDTGDYLGVFSAADCNEEVGENQTKLMLVPRHLAHVFTGYNRLPIWEWKN